MPKWSHHARKSSAKRRSSTTVALLVHLRESLGQVVTVRPLRDHRAQSVEPLAIAQIRQSRPPGVAFNQARTRSATAPLLPLPPRHRQRVARVNSTPSAANRHASSRAKGVNGPSSASRAEKRRRWATASTSRWSGRDAGALSPALRRRLPPIRAPFPWLAGPWRRRTGQGVGLRPDRGAQVGQRAAHTGCRRSLPPTVGSLVAATSS
jgi:hypothetical protein